MLLAAVPAGVPAAEVAVPPELQPWQDWALHGLEYRRCPFLPAADPARREAYRCTWPERLSVRVDTGGGEFSQRWQVFAESWVTLPGSLEHWPVDVRRDGEPAPVVAREGVPQLRLAPGSHLVSGRLRWEARPEVLPVSPRTALVDLTVDGQRVAEPERPGGALRLGRRQSARQPAALDVQVHRLLQDEIPGRLQTRIRLQVAGDGREELLGRALPEGFLPVALASELAARLEADGRLRVQLRAGTFEIALEARAPGVLASVARPATGEGAWPRDEVWSFQGNERLRVAVAQGAEGIDPAQAAVPAEWQGWPAFRLLPGSSLAIEERSRGLAASDENRLTLARELWLDFDHEGFTARDVLRGTLRRDWRLDMHAPFALAHAQGGGETLLVTTGAGGATGVELRTPQLDLVTLARVTGTRAALPATGWQSRFDTVSGTIHLPPGHRLLAALSDVADVARGSWWSLWGLWSFFGLCIVVALTYRLAGTRLAAVAFGALVLTYQEAPDHLWLWANLLGAVAVARAVPVDGRFRRAAERYRLASFALLGLALLPLAFGQLQLALHPQLDADAGFDTAAPVAPPFVPPPDVAIDLPMSAADQATEAVTMTGETAPQPASEPERRLRGALAKVAAAPGERLDALQVVARHAPGTLLQAGPGVPAWRYRSYDYAWSGPVEAGDTLRVIYAGPVLLGAWRIAGVLLLALWFGTLLHASYATRWRWPFGAGPGSSVPPALAVLALLVMTGIALPAHAEATPDGKLLDLLRQRLVETPACVPTCAEITQAQVDVEGQRLDVTLAVSTLARVAVALPHGGDHWQLDTVTVDGAGAPAIARETDGAPWLALAPGTHSVRLSGRLADVASIPLAFPQLPRAVSVAARGWTVTGVNAGRLVSGALELVRVGVTPAGAREGGTAPGTAAAGGEFPGFVRVVRRFDLGLDWTVTTEVGRIAPERAAVTVQVPLVVGESVLTPGVEVTPARDVLVGLAPGQVAAGWTSALARTATLDLAMPQDAARVEVWTFSVHPQWRVAFDGQPAVLPDDPDAPAWVYTYYPRAGERLALHVVRPAAVPGSTLAIDAATQSLRLGERTADAGLDFTYRSTQGGRHAIRLPPEARVQSVAVDGEPLAIRPEPDGELSLGVLPGVHQVAIRFELPGGAALATRPAAVDLQSGASNVRTVLELPRERWALATLGGDAGVGPVILYWSELAAFFVLAVFLGRQSWSPLRAHEWLLLGLGLSTQSWGVFALVGSWFIALRWRSQWSAEGIADWLFDLVQAALVLLTVVALSGLVFTGIRYGFLSTPDMGVIGAQSGGNTFAWFADRTTAALPQPVVLSVPLWAYKALVFAWALWIAWRLALHWLPWAWRAWIHGGFWRRTGRLLAR